MDTTTIVLVATLATTTLGSLLALLQKYIRKSSCLGSSIEFRSNEEIAQKPKEEIELKTISC